MTKARKTNLFFLGLLVFYIVAFFFFVPYFPKKYYNETVSILMSQGIIALPGVIYIIAAKGKPLHNIGRERLGGLNVLLLILFTFFMVPTVSFINALSMMFVKNHLAEQMDGMTSNPLWLNLVLMALIPAIVEEMTFRGLLYCGYRDSSIKRAIFASALLFGLFHMNLNQFCYAAFMAIIFALLYEATGSIYASMIVHFTFNANSVILQKVLDIVQKFVTERAKYDEDFKEVAEQLVSSGSETVTSYADYPFLDKIYMLVTLFISAAMMGAIAVVIFKVIAQRCHRENHVKQVLCSIIGRPCKDGAIKEGEYVEDNRKCYGGKIIDEVFLLGVVLCIALMIYMGV